MALNAQECDTLTKKKRGKRSEMFMHLAFLYSREYQLLMRKSPMFQSQTLYCTLAIETIIEIYFSSKVRKAHFTLMA